VPQALLLAALLWLCWPSARSLLRASRPARLGLALSVGIGLALHLLMDFTNSYGVHPWYPFDGRWLYGDMVFIIEPLFWVAIGVPMALIMRWRWLRMAGLLALFAALVFFAAREYIGWVSFAALLLIAGGVRLAQWRAGEQGAVACCWRWASAWRSLRCRVASRGPGGSRRSCYASIHLRACSMWR
jgi:inner membrane protein